VRTNGNLNNLCVKLSTNPLAQDLVQLQANYPGKELKKDFEKG
jgi:hypothetical protein